MIPIMVNVWKKSVSANGRMSKRLLFVMFLLLFFVDYLIHPNISPHVEICGGLLMGLIGIAASTAVSTAVSSLTSAGGKAVNNAFFGSPEENQKELMDYQYQKQKDFVDYQNEYNTPANQLDRFEQAGVNPNLAMNFGLGSSGNSSYSMPNPNQFRVAQDFQNLMEDSFYKQNQSKLAEALAKSEDTFRDSKLEQLMIQNKHENIVTDIAALEKGYKEEFGRTKYAAEIHKDIQGALSLHYQAYKFAMEGDVESVEAMFKYQDKLYDLGLKRLNYEFESSTLKDRVKQVQQDLINLAEEQKEIKARTNAANASAQESRAHANVYDSQKQWQDLENRVKKVEVDKSEASRQEAIDAIKYRLARESTEESLKDTELKRKIEAIEKARSNEFHRAWDNLVIYLRHRYPNMIPFTSASAKVGE